MNISRIKLSRYEKAIEKEADKYVNVSKEEFEEISRILAAYKKDAVLNIRINSRDLKDIKAKAQKLGVRYQTFIAEILHRVAQTN
jgi:predicted DNA binding CopG/RHH family protein